MNLTKGIRVLGRGLSHPECEYLPFAAEGMGETVPWGAHKVPRLLSVLASHDRDILRTSHLPLWLTLSIGYHELQRGIGNIDFTIDYNDDNEGALKHYQVTTYFHI